MTLDVIVVKVFLIMLPFSMEAANCLNPHYNGEYENVGFVWQWYADDFQVAERRIWKEPKRYTLKYYDENDNYIERLMRKRYWKIKNKKNMEALYEIPEQDNDKLTIQQW